MGFMKTLTATCEHCGSTITTTRTKNTRKMVYWMRELGWQISGDMKDPLTRCPAHRTRKYSRPAVGVVQMELFPPEPLREVEEALGISPEKAHELARDIYYEQERIRRQEDGGNE